MWFTVSLLFKGVHEIEPEARSIWEEVILLVQADCESDARTSAERVGKAKEHEYYVSHPTKHLLKWVFIQVERVYSIGDDSLQSGVELFSRFLRQSEVDSLLTPFEDEPPLDKN